MNIEYEKKSTEMVKRTLDEITLKSKIKEVKIKDKFVSTKNKTLSEALAEIGLINNQSYLLKGEDIQLPYVEGYQNIKDIYSLKTFIEDTTEKTIQITNNKFVKNRVKAVRLVDKEAVGNELKDITFSLSGKELDLRESLNLFSKKTGFSIVYNNKTTTVDTQQQSSEFKAKIVSYQGVTAQQFIEYLRTSLNFYIDVDYVNKLCKIEKYRLREIPLMVTNRNISKSAENSGINSTQTEGSASEGASVQSEIQINVYEAFKNTLDALLTNINTKTGDNNFASIDENTGIVSIYATNQAMSVLEKKVKNFNKSYGITGYATITIFELIVRNNYTVGSNWNYSNSNTFTNTQVGVNTNNITDTVSSIISFANSNATGTKTLDIIASSLNDIGYVTKRTEYGSKFRNHIPSSLKELTVTNYVKNSTTDTVAGDTSTTTSTSTETAEIVAGSETIVMPKINGNDVSVYVSISDTIIESINKETFGTAEINIPTTKPRILDDEFVMKLGESQVVKNINSYEDADKYKGIVPIKDFIIGGEKSNNFVRKELIYVLTISE
jgi:hypothetical protein